MHPRKVEQAATSRHRYLSDHRSAEGRRVKRWEQTALPFASTIISVVVILIPWQIGRSFAYGTARARIRSGSTELSTHEAAQTQSPRVYFPPAFSNSSPTSIASPRVIADSEPPFRILFRHLLRHPRSRHLG
jgi:hypothetical protein